MCVSASWEIESGHWGEWEWIRDERMGVCCEMYAIILAVRRWQRRILASLRSCEGEGPRGMAFFCC